jgi:hypothetical protein
MDWEVAWPGEDCQVAAGLAFSHRSGQPGGQSHLMWPGVRNASWLPGADTDIPALAALLGSRAPGR